MLAGMPIGGLTLAAAATTSNRFWFTISRIHMEPFRYNDRLCPLGSSDNESRSFSAMQRWNALRSLTGSDSKRPLRGLTLRHDKTLTDIRPVTNFLTPSAVADVFKLSIQNTAFLTNVFAATNFSPAAFFNLPVIINLPRLCADTTLHILLSSGVTCC